MTSRQLILVIAENAEDRFGELRVFERNPLPSNGDETNQLGEWIRNEEIQTRVILGKNGQAWGRGLHEISEYANYKIEGDGKTPSGIFKLGTAFGKYSRVTTGLPYQQMTSKDWCVDSKTHPKYNTLVKFHGEGEPSFSHEPMLRRDNQYEKGIFVYHNPRNIPGYGSCIFIHLKRPAGSYTAGCTAFEEPEMDALLAWLEVDKEPVFVVLPREEYEKLKDNWLIP